jgi:general secretion pathway protein E
MKKESYSKTASNFYLVIMNPTSALNQEELIDRFKIEKVTNLNEYPFVKKNERIIPYGFAKKKLVLPLALEDDLLKVAMASPFDFETIEELRAITGRQIKELYCPQCDLETAIEKCYHQSDDEASQYIEDLHKQTTESYEGEEEVYDLLDQKTDSPVIGMLNVILIEAIQQTASDIHFEPQENSMVVRYRIDGVLQHRHSPPREYQMQLLTRIKVMAKLDIAEHRLPQDGRIKLKMGGREVDFRVSTVPVVYGERIVLRILDKSNVVYGLEKMGMDKETLRHFKKHISQNQGIVLVTGPTGSGKTTTLYSAISDINTPDINVMTVEDPVEYKLPGMAQIGVNPRINLSFSVGLRHILRQDPDVIMIGEIRDVETAEIAIQASLTGHLVLSTLHTNDAPSALTRLVDMGIEPYLLTSSVIAIVAQRLVRTICLHCKTSYKPTQSELDDLGIDTDLLWKGAGCEHCFDSGYKGRHGIYELMPVTGQIKRQLLSSIDATGLQETALKEGMSSLRCEGAKLACRGITTSSEVLRVTRDLKEI